MSTTGLSRAAGSAALTTLRGHLRELAALGLLERDRGAKATDGASFAMTAAGFEFLEDAEVARAWLAQDADGPIDIGTLEAKSRLKILAAAWSSALIHALAARPLSMTGLAEVIDLNYPAIERRMRGMRLVGLLEPAPADGSVRPYKPTEWLRRAVGPLVAAARWEQVNSIPGSQSFGQRDMVAALSLVAPLIRASRAGKGSCRLEVKAAGRERKGSTAGVVLNVSRGRIVSYAPDMEEKVDSSASGSSSEWFWALTENDSAELKLGGDKALARGVIAGLYRFLFD